MTLQRAPQAQSRQWLCATSGLHLAAPAPLPILLRPPADALRICPNIPPCVTTRDCSEEKTVAEVGCGARKRRRCTIRSHAWQGQAGPPIGARKQDRSAHFQGMVWLPAEAASGLPQLHRRKTPRRRRASPLLHRPRHRIEANANRENVANARGNTPRNGRLGDKAQQAPRVAGVTRAIRLARHHLSRCRGAQRLPTKSRARTQGKTGGRGGG